MVKQIFINGVSMQVLQFFFFAKIYIAASFFGFCNSILTKQNTLFVQIMKMQSAKKKIK